MDDESNSESDTSESWYVLDINPNDESISLTNAQLEEIHPPDSEDEVLQESSSRELEDFVRRCRESVSGFQRCTPCDYDPSVENQKMDELGRASEEDSKDDAESIEILDIDGHHRDSEIERLEMFIGFDKLLCIDSEEAKKSTYQTDDEESWDGIIDNKIPSISSTVIKRKVVAHSESSCSVVNSVKSNENCNLNKDPINAKMHLDSSSNQPVYKHYRNNVVNTVLSLSVGVIFAGVACIAVGHFLGIHDGTETAVELADTLKKVQLENIALQSRLSELNKAVLKRNINSKFELPARKPQTVSCDDRTNFGQVKTKTTNINRAALSEINSSLKSIQWLTKLENVMNEKSNDCNKIDFASIGKYIHDQLNILNSKKEEGIKILEDSDKKISKVLQKIVQRLSASQDNIEKLYNRLIRLKDKMNHKITKFFPEEEQKRVPVTENDLNSFQWYPRGVNSPEQSSKSPQMEDFYKTSNDSVVEVKMSKKKKEKNERKVNKEKRRKKREKTGKESEKKVQEKRKQASDSKMIKKSEPKQMKYTSGRFNETKECDRKLPKEKSEEKPKRKYKKVKKSKILRAVLSKPKGRSRKNRYSRICSGNECFNLTGFWVFKYADGREEFRRHQTLSDWQFERAKARKEQRGEDDVGSWQFKRALARENDRNDHRWRPESYRKDYEKQDLFHEEFSWI